MDPSGAPFRLGSFFVRFGSDLPPIFGEFRVAWRLHDGRCKVTSANRTTPQIDNIIRACAFRPLRRNQLNSTGRTFCRMSSTANSFLCLFRFNAFRTICANASAGCRCAFSSRHQPIQFYFCGMGKLAHERFRHSPQRRPRGLRRMAQLKRATILPVMDEHPSLLPTSNWELVDKK